MPEETKPNRELVPWLEFYPPGSSRPDITKLDRLPLTIGRSETCRLRLDSKRVSREHAVVRREGPAYILDDLQSTNGTFVNGQRIERARLHHGDRLVFADVPFSFCDRPRDNASRVATQLISTPGAGDARMLRSVIRAVRRAHEMATCRGVRVRLDPIVCLEHHEPIGYEATSPEIAADGSDAEAERQLLGSDCRPAARLRHVYRLMAAEQIGQLADETSLFLPIPPWEVGARALPDALSRIDSAMGANHRLVAAVPGSAVCDIPFFREFLQALRARGIGVAYGDFGGGEAQLEAYREILPDYVLLARSCVAGARANEDRREQLRAVAKGCEQLGCAVVATGVQTAEDEQLCRSAGCRFAQGALGRRARPTADCACST